MELHEMISQAPLWRPCGYPQCSNKITLVTYNDQFDAIPEFLKAAIHSIYIPRANSAMNTTLTCPGANGSTRQVSVQSLDALEGAFDSDIVFFNSFFDTPRWDIAANELLKRGFRSFFVFMPIPPNQGLTTTHIPGYYNRNKADLDNVFTMLEDDESKEVFASRIRSLETGNTGYTLLSKYPEYFHPEVLPEEGDIIMDGGISSHVVAQEALSNTIGPSGRLYGFEPDPVGFVEASDKLQNLELNNIELLPLGLWKGKDTLHFKSIGQGSFVTQGPQENTIACEMTSVDDFVKENGVERVDFLKLDVEGSEFNAIRGAIKTIVQHKPKLAISIYHLPQDIYVLPKLIKQIGPEYKFYMGHHQPCLHETILYAKV